MTIFRGPGGGGNATNDAAINILTGLSTAASNSATSSSASATAAGVSATNAATSASASATSASGASTSADTATTQASNASTSASGASTSASNGATSAAAALASQNAAATSQATASTAATTATTQASGASTSATNAASSATTASTQASNAATSAGTATTQATNASSSASTATTQAGLATTNGAAQVALATTQATNSATSATNAASSASTASTQATNASSSATAASGSASTASTQASNASTSASGSSTSATNAASSASTASTQATNASSSASGASTSATNASNSATAASGSASTASTQASNSSSSASGASTSASNAATSATNASNSATAASNSAASINDSTLVHKTGNETIAGIKTFTSSVVVPSITFPDLSTQASSQVGFKNKLINSQGLINQRAVSGTVTLASGVYGHDRFKAGASGVTYTFALSANVVTFTITAGSLIQIVEGLNLQTGTFCLGWAGTAQGKIAAGSFAAAGVTASITGGVNTTIEFGTGTLSLPQLERGVTATTFDYRDYGRELLLCQRYYWRETAGAAFSSFANSVIEGTTVSSGMVRSLPVTMRAIPTCGFSSCRLFDGTASPAATSLGVNYSSLTTWGTAINASGGGLTVGRAVSLQANNSTSAYIEALSEL